MSTNLETLNKQFELNTQARAFVKWGRFKASCVIAATRGGDVDPFAEATDPALETFHKAAVAGMTATTDSALRRASQAFVNILEKRTVLGRLTGTTPAPPYTSMVGLNGDLPEPEWLGEGRPIPVARVNFQAPQTSISKFGILMPVTKELVTHADERAISLLERVLMRAIRRAEDQLLLTADAAVTDVSPEGLLHGVSESGGGGGSPLSLDSDVTSLWHNVSDGDPIAPHFIASPRGLVYLASVHESGAPRFPNVGPLGGDLFGVPVIPSAAAADKLILVDAGQIVVTDEGAVIEASGNAAVQQDDAPTNSAATGTGAQLVSSFQTNVVFLRVVRYLHWLRVTDDATGYILLPIGTSPM